MLLTALALAAGLHLDAPIVLTAQSPASSQETSLVPWFGVRAGYAFDDDDGAAHDGVHDGAHDGVFSAVEGALLFGLDGQGTNEVAVTRLPVLVEARGVYGSRVGFGLVSLGGYGYVGGGVGGGPAYFQAFDDARLRAFGLWVVRGGGGVELSFLQAFTRVEVGAGVRDLRPELSGCFAVGGRF